MTWLEFELGDYDVTVQHISHYTKETLLISTRVNLKFLQYFGNVRDNLAVWDAFALVVKVTNHSRLRYWACLIHLVLLAWFVYLTLLYCWGFWIIWYFWLELVKLKFPLTFCGLLAPGSSWATFWVNKWSMTSKTALDLLVCFKLWAGICFKLSLYLVSPSPAGSPGSHCTQWAYDQHRPAGCESWLLFNLLLL